MDSLGYHEVDTILQHEPDLLFIAMGDNDLQGDLHKMCSKLLKWICLFEDRRAGEGGRKVDGEGELESWRRKERR